MATDSMLAEILNTTRSLSVEEKVQLIRGMTDQVEQDLKGIKKTQKISLRGIWKGLDLSQGDAFIYIPTICLVEILYLEEKGCIPLDKEIRENRKEMWGNFPKDEKIQQSQVATIW